MTATNLPRVPDGLRDLVKNYTKEVLREKPADLYKFSLGYFESIAGRRTKKKMLKYEPQQSYETIMRNRNRQQMPLSLAFHIIPQNLTDVIKQFIKAVLRENPQDIILFAVEYFKKLLQTSSGPQAINYSTYEKYLDDSRSAPPAPKVKCECGRILSSKDMRIQVGPNPLDQATPTLGHCTGDQHIRAVVTIQKYFRRYLRRRAQRVDKVTPKPADAHESAEVLNAVLLIQRQIRRLLERKRAKRLTEAKSQSVEIYHSIKHLRSVLIIQRHIREYLKRKKSVGRSLSKREDSWSERNISFTNAAFVIQRAFRRVIRARRAKIRKTGEPEQVEEVNDTASEAASYTSASTALLSTESTGDHDLGTSNYEDAVHQQTIKEDEEVDNDNAYNRKYIKARRLQSSAKSSYSDAKADMINNNVNETESIEIENENNAVEDTDGLEINTKVEETPKLFETTAKGKDLNIPTANEEPIKQEFIDLQMEHTERLSESNKLNLSATNMGIVADSTKTDEVPENNSVQDKDEESNSDIKDSQSFHENSENQDASSRSGSNSADCNNKTQGTKENFETPRISGETFICGSIEAHGEDRSSDNVQRTVERTTSLETKYITDGAAISESSLASRESEQKLRTDVAENSAEAQNPIDHPNLMEHQNPTEESVTKLDLSNEKLEALPECQQTVSSSNQNVGKDTSSAVNEGDIAVDVNTSNSIPSGSTPSGSTPSESKSSPDLVSANNSSIEQNVSVGSTGASQQLESETFKTPVTTDNNPEVIPKVTPSSGDENAGGCANGSNEEPVGDNTSKSPESTPKSSEDGLSPVSLSKKVDVNVPSSNVNKTADNMEAESEVRKDEASSETLNSEDDDSESFLALKKFAEEVKEDYNIISQIDTKDSEPDQSKYSISEPKDLANSTEQKPHEHNTGISGNITTTGVGANGSNEESVVDSILQSPGSTQKSSGDGISQVSLSKKVDVNVPSSNINITADNMEAELEYSRDKASSGTFNSEDDDSESFLALKKFVEEVKDDFNIISQIDAKDSEPDQSKDSIRDHKDLTNSTEQISHENNTGIPGIAMTAGVGANRSNEESVADSILKSPESTDKSFGDGISQVSLSKKVDVNVPPSDVNMTVENMEPEPEYSRDKASSGTLNSDGSSDGSESFLALKKFAEEVKDDFNNISQIDATDLEPDQSKDPITGHKDLANSTEKISRESNTEILGKTTTTEIVDENQISPENQYSIEVSSLQTVLKNLHNQQMNGQNKVSEKYESNSSNIDGREPRSPTFLGPPSTSEASENDTIVTSLIIHSVLPTEGDYELRLSSPIPIAVDTITASESVGSNLSSFKDVIENTTSEEDLTVVEKDTPDDRGTKQSSPNDRPDHITSSTLDASEIQDENVTTEKNTSSDSGQQDIAEDKNNLKSELGNSTKDTINESTVQKNLGTTETSIDPVAPEQQFDEPRQTESRLVSEVENKQLADNGWNTEKTLLIESNDSNDQNHELMKDTESHISTEKNARLDSSEISPTAPVYAGKNSESLCDERDENTKDSSTNKSEKKGEICGNVVEVSLTESPTAETGPMNSQQDDGQSRESNNNSGNVKQTVKDEVESRKRTNQSKDAGKCDDFSPEVNTESHAVTPNKVKKMPAVKEKQLSKFTSNRLIPAPIAELQLKSFKTSADGGQWYEVHNDNNMDATKDEDHQITEAYIQRLDPGERGKNGKSLERSPRYLNGDQLECSEPVKRKQSVSFFISFDSNSDKPSFRIPKRFLRAAEDTSAKINSQNAAQSEDNQDQAENDVNYQEFGKPKLQTIHELNENESTNELITDTNIASYTGNLAHTDLPDCSNEGKLVEQDGYVAKQIDSANIIKSAFKQYKDRQSLKKAINLENKTGIDSNEGKIIPDLKSAVSQSDSAMKIQRAFRKFLAKRKSEPGQSQNKHYTAAEIMAAIKIQNVLRDFIRRKNAAKPEWFVGSQRISIEGGKSSAGGKTDEAVPELAGHTPRDAINGDTEGKCSGELATDIGNTVNELSAGKACETYNGPSHNLAGASNEAEFDLVQEVEAAARSPSQPTPVHKINRTSAVINEFLDQEIKFSSENMQKIRNYNDSLEEVHEVQCVKRKVSLSNLDENNSDAEAMEGREEESAANNGTRGELDTLEGTSLKLSRTDKTIEKMTKRRSLEIREKEERKDFQITEPVFDEPLISPLSLLQEQNSLDLDDGEIVYSRLQREDTRESSAQSENVVFGNTEDDRLIPEGTDITRSQLSRHYTIAGDDPKTVFKSVIASDTVKLMSDESGVEGANDGKISSSFCLDDETSENIRQKIMAYSLSEADSDYYDSNKVVKDDFHVDTAMTDALDTSTETESTIVSAAAKIQAGARGFLTRRRLRRASAGTTSSTQETKASFGNDAISESLERIIEEEAARKIQAAYRYHSKKPKKPAEIPESMSLENNLAAKRQTLQRGDALQNDSNSTPEDENEKPLVIVGNISELNSATEIRSKKSNDSRVNWSGLRQNSMPVQIDCEVLRLVPKHKRRRIKSAQDKQQRPRK